MRRRKRHWTIDRLRIEGLEDRRLLTAMMAIPTATVPAAVGSLVVPAVVDPGPSVTGPSSLSAMQGKSIPLDGANLISVYQAGVGNNIEAMTIAVSGGTLSVGTAFGNLIGGANNSGTISFSGTLAQLNDTLATLSYTAPTSGSAFTLTVVAGDGIVISTPLYVPIAVQAGLPPTLAGPNSLSVTQGASIPLNGANLITVSDIDSSNNIETVGVAVSGGTLSVTSDYGSLIGGANNSATLIFSGTVAQLNSTLATLNYKAPVSGSTLELSAIAADGTLNSTPLDVSITILPDRAPVLVGPSSLSVTQGVSIPLNGANLITDLDSDGGNDVETVALSVTSGALAVASDFGSLIGGANNTDSLTLSGTLTQLNSTLATLSYKAPIAGETSSLTAVANDGILSSMPLTVPITVLADIAPVLSGPVGLTVTQGASLPLNVTNLITVADADGGNNVETVTLSVSNGTLTVTADLGTLVGGANNSSMLKLSGTLAELNGTLATLSYTAPVNGSAYTLTAVANDGVLSSVPLEVPITVLADLAPTLAGPASLTATQGSPLALNGADLIRDSDSPVGTVLETVALTVTGGTLSITSDFGTLLSGANNSGALTIRGTITQLNNTLATLTYQSLIAGPAYTLTAIANDGILSSTPLSVPITILGDQPPVLAGPAGITVSQGASLPLNGANLVTVSDVDGASNVETVSLSVTGGTLSFTSNFASLISGANNSGAMTFSGTLSQLDRTLATLSYKAPTSGSGFTLTAVANDGILSSLPLSMPITVPPDIAPVVAGPSGLSVTQGASIRLNGADLITVSDVDGAANIETLTLTASGGTLSVTSAFGSLIAGANNTSFMTISGTLPQLNSTLATLSYKAPVSGAAFTLTAVANDGDLNSVPLNLPVTILGDLAPVLNGPSSLIVTQGASIPLNGINLITDSDGDAGTSIETLALTVSGGSLSIASDFGSLIGGANNSSELTLSGTLAQLNDTLASLSYRAPGTGSAFTLVASANDGVLSSTPLDVPIAIDGDIAPNLTGPASLNVTQGTSIPLNGPSLITVSDVDGATNLETVALTVSSGTLAVAADYGILIGGANDTNSLTFSGTLAQLNNTLATLSYKAPLSGTASALSVVANDGILNSAPLGITLNILADAAPTLSGPSSVSITSGETIPLNGANLITVSDVDGGTNLETVSLAVSSGTLSIATDFGSLIGGANNSGSLILSGTIAQLNSSLATLTFTAPISGAALTLTVVANDGVLSSTPLYVSLAYPASWQNQANPLDVNNDGVVTPADALVIINYLNEYGSQKLPPITQDPQYFYDVNGDGYVTPSDALAIIDYLNSHAVSAEAQPAVSSVAAPLAATLACKDPSPSQNSNVISSASHPPTAEVSPAVVSDIAPAVNGPVQNSALSPSAESLAANVVVGPIQALESQQATATTTGSGAPSTSVGPNAAVAKATLASSPGFSDTEPATSDLDGKPPASVAVRTTPTGPN